MIETNSKSTSRLLVESCCWFKESLYSKTLLLFTLLLLPAMIFAQSNKQLSEKEARNQAYMEAIYGNKPEAVQAKQVNDVKQIQAQEIATENVEVDAYQNLLEKYNFQADEAKLLNSGMSKAQIEAAILAEIESIKNAPNPADNPARMADISDTCAGADTLFCSEGISQGSTVGFGNDNGVGPRCGGPISSGGGVWYKVLGNGESTQVALSNAFNGAFLQLYTGGCGALACNTDSNIGQGTQNLAFNTVNGQEYWVLVTGQGNNEGSFDIEAFNNSCSGPTGDGLSSATAFPIDCGDVDSGDTTGFGNTEVGPACGNTTGNVGVWYVVNVTGNFPAGTGVTVDLCGSAFDTEIHVYSTSALDCVIAEDDDFTNCGGNDPSVDFDAQPGVDYYIYISGFSSFSNGTGAYDITVACDGIAPPPPPSVPNNDDCPNAEEIVCTGVDQVIPGTTVLATADDEPADSCGNALNGVGVWYFLEGDGSSYIIGTCGYDTELTVLSGQCGSLTCIQSNDDTTRADCTGSFGESQVTFNTVDGEIYYIYVSSFGTTTQSDFDLLVSCIPPPEPPANDDCEDAETIACGDFVDGNTALATADINPACGDNAANGTGVWYEFSGTGDLVDLDLQGVTFDAVVSVYTGGCDTLVCVAGENGDFSDDSQLRFLSVAGTDYLIYVSGLNGAVGAYTLDLSCQPDPCSIADPISCGDAISGSNSGASGSTAGPTEFCGTTPGVKGNFYVFTGNDMFVNVNTCDSNFDTKLNVYSGSCGTLTCVTGNDDVTNAACGISNRTSSVDFFAEAGQTYYIWVAGFGTATGDYVVELTCQDVVENDLCDAAVALNCGQTIQGSTGLSTDRDAPEAPCDAAGDAEKGVWYTIAGTGGDINLSTCGAADFDTNILVFASNDEDNPCDDLECVAGNDDAVGCAGGTSEVQFPTTQGVTYYIYVSGFGTQTGTFELTVDCICFTASAECVTLYEGYAPTSSTTLTGMLLGTDAAVVSYLWNTGATTQSITVNASAGTQQYSVTITDAEGCMSTQEFFVYVVDIDCDRGNSDKIEICHNGNTICVSVNAAQAHLNHGDSLGACGTATCDELIPFCDSMVTSPVNGEVGVSIRPTISWSSATGIVDGYILNVETSGGTAVIDNQDVGDVQSFEIDFDLDYETTYVVTVTPYNSNGNAIGCSSSSFTTVEDPLPNDDCAGAVGLTVNASDDPCAVTYQTDHTDATDSDATFSCDIGTNNLDSWYTFTAPASGTVDVEVTNGTQSGTTEMALFDSCDGTQLACTFGATQRFEGLTAGTSYTLAIWYDDFNTEGTFTICVNEYTPPPARTVVCDSPENTVYCYGNNDSTQFQFTSADGSPLEVVFNSGTIESCCDDIIIYDGLTTSDPILYSGNNGGNLAGLTINGTSDSIMIVVDSDGSISCASGSRTSWDFDVDCYVAGPVETCENSTTVSGYTYTNSTTESFVYTSTDGTPIKVDFTSGRTENNFDELIILDTNGSQLYNGYGNGGDLSGLSFQATGDTITVRVTPDSSVNSSTSNPWNYTVSWTCSGGEEPEVCDNTTTVTGYTYTNNVTESFVYTSTDGTPIRVEFMSGRTENNFDELIILDTNGTQLYNGYGASGDLTGLSFQATGDTITVRVTPDSSVNSSTSNPWNYVVSWTCSGGPTPEVCANTNVISGYTYTNNLTQSFVYTSTDGSAIKVDFNSGRTENNFDELIILDTNGTQLYNGYGASGDLTGLSFQASGDTITVRVTPDSSVNSSTANPWNYTVSWTCTGGARAAAPTADLTWNMYPNPSKGQVNLDLKDFTNNDINVQVIDLRGNIVLSRAVKNLQDSKLQIELNNVPYGVYMVRVQSNDNVSTKRLIISN